MAERTVPSLALEPEALRALGARIADLAAARLGGLRARPVFTPMAPETRRALMEQPLPQEGQPAKAIVERIAAELMPYPMGNGHPRFFGWVNSPPAPLAALTETLAAALNPSCAGGDHAAIYLEHAVIAWLKELTGFPAEGSYGLLTSGGSMASLTALAAARHAAARQDGWDLRAEGLQGDRPRLMLYLSSETHSCVRKSVELLGLGNASLRVLPADGAFRLDPAAVRQAITADMRAGLRPFCVVASAGTVNTGAIDPFAALAEICAEHGLWLHVDGAYGAFGRLDPDAAPLYAGLEQADSLALDPHKWLSTPVECGALLVRDGALLRDAFSLVPPYLQSAPDKGFGGLPWFSEYGFQQTRGFRALKLWVTLLALGRDGATALIARHRALAKRLAAAIDAAPDLERMAPVTLSVVCFRYRPSDWRGGDPGLDALNQAIAETIQAEGEAFVTHTRLGGRLALRASILHYGTTEADVDFLVALVERVGARLAQTRGSPR